MGDVYENEDGVADDESEKFSLDHVSFRGMTLTQWEDFLTVEMPKMPATAVQLSEALATINNKFQICYNCYNALLVDIKKIDMSLKSKMRDAIKTEAGKLKANGANRLPAKETLEAMAIQNNEDISTLFLQNQIYDTVMTFFENNKNKLGSVMKTASDLLYAATYSDRIFNKAPIGGL